MKTAELTLYRCYWPPAFGYLKNRGIKEFTAKAYDLLMTLELASEQAYAVAALLPTGAVVDIVPVDTEPCSHTTSTRFCMVGEAPKPVSTKTEAIGTSAPPSA